MKLSSFSQVAQAEIQHQAFHHMFFADNFFENLEHVKQFEENQNFLLTHLIDIYYYLYSISDDNLYYPLVQKNVVQYIDYYWKDKKVLPIHDYNILHFIEKRNQRDFCMNYPSFSLWRINSAFESVWWKKLVSNLKGHKKVTEEVLSFFVSSFEFTKAMVTSQEKAMESLTYNEQFLAYCNYLLNSGSSLIFESEYFSMIQDLLYANDNLCRKEPFELSCNFRDENSRILKRMESIPKISTTYYG